MKRCNNCGWFNLDSVTHCEKCDEESFEIVVETPQENSTPAEEKVAEVAVNKAGRKPQDTPLLDAAGSISSRVPSRMISAKPMAMILVAFRFLARLPEKNR